MVHTSQITEIIKKGWQRGNEAFMRNWWVHRTAARQVGLPDQQRRQRILDSLHELRGKTLMCFCEEGTPCHGDVLLRRANSGDAR